MKKKIRKLSILTAILIATTTLTVSGQIEVDTNQFDWLLQRHNAAILYQEQYSNCDSINKELMATIGLKQIQLNEKDTINRNNNIIISRYQDSNQQCAEDNEKKEKKIVRRGKIIAFETIIILTAIITIILKFTIHL